MIRPLSSLFLIVLLSGTSFATDREEIQTLHIEAEQLFETRDETGYADQAIAIYKKILQIKADDETAFWKLSRSYRWRGEQLSPESNQLAAYKMAKNYAKQAIAINSESVGGHLMLGIAYGRIGESQGILKSLFLISPIKKEMALVLRFDPENDVARHVLAILYRKMPRWVGGSNKRSIQLLKEAIQINPNRTSHHLELAHSYLKQKNQTEAIHSLQILLKIQTPEDRVRAKSDRRDAEALLKRLDSTYSPP